jgi:polyisoprenoid-binding protein YceI
LLRGPWAASLVALPMALAPVSARGQALAPAPLRSAELRFAIRATRVNDFVGRVDSVHAQFTGTDVSNVSGWVEFRVRDMHTGIGLRDTHMRNAMRADSFPTVRFELVGLDPSAGRGDTIPTVFQGHLTIRGVTKTVRVPGTVVIRPDGADVEVGFPLDMREYGIEPPTRFFGAVRVDPVTTIRARLAFGG